MNLVDLLILVALVIGAAGGYQLGFIARVLSWVGLALGVAIGMAFMPTLTRELQGMPTGTTVLIVASALLASASIGSAIGSAIGHRVRGAVVPRGGARAADHLGGAVAGALGVLFVVWLIAPLAAEVPGGLSRAVRESEIAAAVHDVAPEPPHAIDRLRDLVGDADFPRVFDSLRPTPDPGPPPGSVGIPDAVVATAHRSTANIEAVACGGVHEGSGFVVGDDLVMTNAHVVAGTSRVRVLRTDGRRLPGQVVAFDDNRDLALVSVPGFNRPALRLGAARQGAQGAVIGHPGGQDEARIAPAAVRDVITATGRDIYGRDRTTRRVVLLASALRPGDSGSPTIDASGAVVGVVFAVAVDRPGTAFALAQEEARAVLAMPRRVGSGPCQ